LFTTQSWQPLRVPAFRRQFTAQVISMVGSTLTPVAVAFGVLHNGGTVADLGLVMAAYSVPMLVLLLVGGVWADRFARHRVMMASNLVRFGTQTTFGVLLISRHNPLWAMMALQVLNGSALAFEKPATAGLTAATAPAALRQQANALIALTRDITGIAGPVIAGAMTVTIGAGWALLIDGTSFLGSAYFLSKLRLPAVSRRPGSFVSEVVGGWREVAGRPWLWISICYFALFNLVFGMLLVLGPARLAARPAGALGWGSVLAALSLGALAGNAVALRITPRYLLRWPRVTQLLVVPMIVALGLGAPVIALAATAFAMGFVMTFPDALWLTALQQEIPRDAISRVSAFDSLGSLVLQPIGYTLAAVALSAGATRSLLGVALLFALATLVTLAVPGLRNLTRRETVSEEDAVAV
jgi:MFS family permease